MPKVIHLNSALRKQFEGYAEERRQLEEAKTNLKRAEISLNYAVTGAANAMLAAYGVEDGGYDFDLYNLDAGFVLREAIPAEPEPVAEVEATPAEEWVEVLDGSAAEAIPETGEPLP